MDSDRLNQLYHFISAYPIEEVKAAYKLIFLEKKDMREVERELFKKHLLGSGWEKFNGTIDQVPEGFQWFVAHDSIMIKPVNIDPAKQNTDSMDEAKPKTDLSMVETDKVCFECGEPLYWEPICPACALGRHGFSGRYVCGGVDMHEFYVLREGVELPNR